MKRKRKNKRILASLFSSEICSRHNICSDLVTFTVQVPIGIHIALTSKKCSVRSWEETLFPFGLCQEGNLV